MLFRSWISTEYMNWLPAFFRTWIRVESEADAGDVRFYFGPLRRPLLELKYIRGRADADRKKFHIVGGLLTRTTNTGWLEFRQVQGRRYTLAAIHEFIPSLPWYLYRMVQAPLHHWVMLRFGRHLARAASRRNGKKQQQD